MSELLDRAVEHAFAALEAVGGAVERLAEPQRTIVVVTTVQGIVDNGGLAYLFGNDLPGQPPYATIVAAYRRIGAESAARTLEQAVAAFPFDAPHLDRDGRRGFLASLEEDHPLIQLGDRLCGDPTVWEALEAFVRRREGADDPA